MLGPEQHFWGPEAEAGYAVPTAWREEPVWAPLQWAAELGFEPQLARPQLQGSVENFLGMEVTCQPLGQMASRLCGPVCGTAHCEHCGRRIQLTPGQGEASWASISSCRGLTSTSPVSESLCPRWVSHCVCVWGEGVPRQPLSVVLSHAWLPPSLCRIQAPPSPPVTARYKPLGNGREPVSPVHPSPERGAGAAGRGGPGHPQCISPRAVPSHLARRACLHFRAKRKGTEGMMGRCQPPNLTLGLLLGGPFCSKLPFQLMERMWVVPDSASVGWRWCHQ